MSLMIRDATVPLGEVSLIVESYHLGTYLAFIPAAILVYDTRTFLVWMMCSISFLMGHQSAHLIKRYVAESLQCDFMVTKRNW